MKRFLLPFLLLLLLALSSVAGDKAVVRPLPQLCGMVSIGYDTAYLFRGANYGDDAPWAGADFNVAFSQNLLLNFGVWYVNPTSKVAVVEDELDLYSYVVFPLGKSWELEAGGTWYYLPEENGDRAELGLKLARKLFGFCKFNFEYVYDLDAEGNYYGYYLDKTIEILDKLEVKLEAGLSHADQNYERRTLAGDRAFAQGGLTYHFRDAVDMNAYVLANFPYGDLEDLGEKDHLYGGVSMTVSF